MKNIMCASSDCKNGASAYVAFQLQPAYDIENIPNLADRFKRKAKRLANQVSLPTDAADNIVFLSSEAKQQLSRFSKSKITKVKFDEFANRVSIDCIHEFLSSWVSQISNIFIFSW